MGVYPDVGLKDARRRRDEARGLLADGTDPGEQRKEAKAAAVAEQREKEYTAPPCRQAGVGANPADVKKSKPRSAWTHLNLYHFL